MWFQQKLWAPKIHGKEHSKKKYVGEILWPLILWVAFPIPQTEAYSSSVYRALILICLNTCNYFIGSLTINSFSRLLTHTVLYLNDIDSVLFQASWKGSQWGFAPQYFFTSNSFRKCFDKLNAFSLIPVTTKTFLKNDCHDYENNFHNSFILI